MRIPLFLLVILTTSAIVLASCSNQQATEDLSATPTINASPTTSPEPVVSETSEPVTRYEFTATESGITALELLQSQANIETKDYGSAGQFVTSINGLAGNNDNFWAFYLNGDSAEKGASQTVLEAGDIIRFDYEPIIIIN